MPGFYIGNLTSDYIISDKYTKTLYRDTKYNNFMFEQNTINKFLDDKCLYEDSSFIVVLEGYLLNKKILFEQYKTDNVGKLSINMYHSIGDAFFSLFRGGFSGAIYDKTKNRLIAYTNQTGEAALFYYFKDNKLFVGSRLQYITGALKKFDISYSFNEDAAYQMLTYAFMIDDSTFVKEIKRLQAGNYIVYENDTLKHCRYHEFKHNFDKLKALSEEQIIEELDKKFRDAIKLEYEKDNEYSYTHLVDMSGGLDSRMTAWVAHDMGIKHLQLITYSKGNYYDELIAKDIAKYWKDEFIFKQLDDASFIYDIELNTYLLNGLSLYSGITGGRQLLDSLAIDKYGLEHTGMIGDVVLGSFCRSMNDYENHLPSGKYSERLSIKYNNETPWNEKRIYDDQDLYLLYSRGMQGAANTELLRQNYTEVSSPFMHVDFFQFCMDIPIELRINHYIYKKWIISKYPEAARFPWEKTGARITDSNFKRQLIRLKRRGKDRLKKALNSQYVSPNNMNPLDYWYSNDKEMQDALEK